MLETRQPADSASGMQALCESAAGVSPLPMLAIFRENQQICFANHAFGVLIGKSVQSLVGELFSLATLANEECLADLTRVFATGQVQERSTDTTTEDRSIFNSYAMWPMGGGFGPAPAVMIQVTESETFRQQAVAINEALLLTSLRQHEAAGLLSEQLRLEAVERNLALAALIKSEKLASLGRMAAAMAHEINNPLEAVTNTLYLARITPGLPESARQFLDMADGELNRIAHITRQTLGFYRKSSAPQRFSVDSLIDSVFDLLRSKIKSKRARVQKDIGPGLYIHAHFGELRQVFSNLMLNSLDAIGDGGFVAIRAALCIGKEPGTHKVRISVADSGYGIDPQALPQIFDPFFTTKGSIGNGLGLWVTREIINKHEGSIRVRSRKHGPHTGTTFSVLLPQAAA